MKDKLKNKGLIYTRINKRKYKIPIITLLQSIGMPKKKIIYSIENKDEIKNFIEINKFKKSELKKNM